MNSTGYSYASQPRPVEPKRRNLFREHDNNASEPVNIMHDPRVYRGNTYSAAAIAKTQQSTAPSTTPASRTITGKFGKTRSLQKSIFDVRVGKKAKIPVSLEENLIEPEHVKQEDTVGTQTDSFLPRPFTPPYVPKKTGIDASTQIMPTDLFNFDVEVEPILNVITYKTLEQSILEVEEEAELLALHTAKEGFVAAEAADRRRIAAMEEDAKAIYAAKEARKAAERRRVAKERSAIAKVTAYKAGRALLSSALSAVLRECERDGTFKDPVKEDIANKWFPGLLEATRKRVEEIEVSRQLVGFLLQGVDSRSTACHDEVLKAKEEEDKRKLRVFIRAVAPDGRETTVGPVIVNRADTVGQVQAKIDEYIQDHPDELKGLKLLMPGGKFPRLAYGGSALDNDATLFDATGATKGNLEVLEQ